MACQKGDIAGAGFADTQGEGLLTPTPFDGIDRLRNKGGSTNVVMSTLINYVGAIKVVVI